MRRVFTAADGSASVRIRRPEALAMYWRAPEMVTAPVEKFTESWVGYMEGSRVFSSFDGSIRTVTVNDAV